MLRVMTYNVHGCVGTDKLLSPERICHVIEHARADVVALQELDVDQPRSGSLNQPEWLARRLGMQVHFVSARVGSGGHYGNAVLSRFPLRVMREACLPQFGRCEPRAAQWVNVLTPTGELNVINTHLGLSRRERLLQIGTLLSDAWFSRVSGKTVVCGDFNALPGSRVHALLCSALRDAQLVCGSRPLRTWPSRLPLMRIDHVFLSRDLHALRCAVPRRRVERQASDHLPLLVDVTGETL